MIIGLEYVIVTYVIWLITFVVYIILTKRRLKTTSYAVTALEERFSRRSASTQKGNNI